MTTEEPAHNIGDEASVEAPPDAREQVETRTKPGRRRRWPTVVIIALVVSTGVAAFAAVTERGRANDADSELDARDEARLVAASFAEAYLSYDYTDVEASQARIAEFASEAWLEDFEATRLREVDELFANIESTTVAETTAVYLGDVSEAAAVALVVVDVEAASAATGDQTLTDLTFLVDLIRVDDQWRVDQVAPPPQANVGNGGTAPEDANTGSSPTSQPTTTEPG